MAAYTVVQVDVKDPEAFERYRAMVPATLEKYGGRYLVRGGDFTTTEGDWDPKRLVIVEFDSREQAEAWYNSEEYAKPKALRLSASESKAIIVDGVPG